MSIIQPIVMNTPPEVQARTQASAKRPEEIPYALALSDHRMKNFCQTVPQFLDSDFLQGTSLQVNESIALLKQRYQ